uniref:Uncharacterized protein n=1 Tax=viral metagenome TaxID=1070528 RepID=A0A6M3JZQ1_9ZZZZ
MTNREYNERRNALIPIAEKFANKRYGATWLGKDEATRLEWVDNWNQLYHGKMNRLWAEEAAKTPCEVCGRTG